MKYQETSVAPDLGVAASPAGHAPGTGGQLYQTPSVVGGGRQSVFKTWQPIVDKPEPEDVRQGLQDLQSRGDLRPSEGQRPKGNLEILGKVLGAVRRQFWLVASLSILLSLLALGIVLILPPQFTATTLLAVDASDGRPTEPAVTGYSLNVDGEVEVMQSMKVAQQVVKRLNLTEDPRFVDKQASSTAGVSGLFTKVLPAGNPPAKQAEGSSQSGPVPAKDAAETEDPAVVRAAVALQKITNVRRRGLTNVIALDITINDPKDAAFLANAYADTYITEQISSKLGAAGHTEAALLRRVAELGEELRRSESQIKAFALVQGAQSSDDAARTSIDRLQADIAAASREAGSQAAKLREADGLLASENYAALGKLLSSPEIVLLDEQRRALEQRVQRPGEGETDLAGSTQRLDLTRSQLRSLSSKSVDNLRRQSEASNSQASALRQELRQVVQKSDLSTDNSVQLFRLQQEAATTRQLYQDYLGRLKAAAQQRSTVTPSVYVVAEAGIPPNRSFPPRSLLLVIGCLAGLGIAVGAGYARDNYPQNIKFVDELEAASRVPNVGVIPDSRRSKAKALQPENLIYARPLSNYSEAIRRLRVSLQLTFNQGAGFKSLLVTSTQRQEGRSTLALSLARDAARAGLKVVLLDCDLRNPSLHSKIGLSNDEGVSTMLLSSPAVLKMSLLQMDPQSSCFVITSGDLGSASADQPLQSPQLGRIVKELEERFDLVIIDTASIETAADALMVAQHVDGVLLVARSTQARPAKVRDALLNLQRTRIGNLATALNFAIAADL
ncbi:GumC family protein [Microvirga sp. CF3016]|uniref:GumC family protein n=1 Tax=Microvirga sp. CF3016 TaxID=3110181 RepID=UPI002E762A1B|nr:Wzz/FepE/Etk N-terminal domain-containing protein [Microvirga sp. CF3016]MEE1612156.1 Wzz/FepE/Etk N-terminal domain-containing protein [Microvirga sp. CF3016]